MNYQIAIPSYKRPKILKKTTLAFLEKHKINSMDIKIFIRDENEKDIYADILGDTYEFIITEAIGIQNTRNFLREYYYNHPTKFDLVLFLDDDIKDIINNEGPIENLHETIDYFYNQTLSRNMRLFGICGFDNSFYFKDTITTNLKYIIGCFCGLINPYENLIKCDVGHGEDYQFTLEHFLRDGGVCRFNNYGVRTKYYNTSGGICEDIGGLELRNLEAERNLKHLAEKYKGMCSVIRKKNGMWDLRLNYRFKVQNVS